MAADLCNILSIGRAVPKARYTQREIIDYLALEGMKGLGFYTHPHIQTRHLVLPPKPTGAFRPEEESRGQLLGKFLEYGIALSREATDQALSGGGCSRDEIAALACVSSTGFMVPALSARLIGPMGLSPAVKRLDVVGMGCNAGLNGLSAMASWCFANPGKKALLICAEICSAIYTFDESLRTAVVNSLFGDGVAAVLLEYSGVSNSRRSAAVVAFESYVIPNTLDYLRFDWDEKKNRECFFIHPKTPKVLQESIEVPLQRLLNRFRLSTKDVQHWIFHTGGAAILDGLERRLKLKPDDLRFTRSILRDYGNISSGSVFFSFDELTKGGHGRPRDWGVMVTMGPGLTIETALVRWPDA